MKKIERNIANLRNALELMNKLANELNCLDYYTPSKYFDDYLDKEQRTIVEIIGVMENMKNDEELLEEED